MQRYECREKVEHKKELLSVSIILGSFLALCLLRGLCQGEYYGDEFCSLRDAAGYAYTGRWLQWDFLTGTTTANTAKAMPFFYILAWTIRLFGTGEMILRLPSALFGILSVASFYIIIRKYNKSTLEVFFLTMALALNPVLVELSLMVRGYTMLLFLNIWLFYFIFRFLHDSSIYIVPVLILIYLAYRIRIFEVLYLFGIGIYVTYLAVTEKKRKYCIMSILFWVGLFMLTMILIFGLGSYFPLGLDRLFGEVERLTNFELKHLRYWKQLGKVFCFFPATLFSICLIIYYHGRSAFNKQEKECIIYCTCIAIGALLLFSTIIEWPYGSDYVLAIYPSLVVIMLFGYIKAIRCEKEWGKGFLTMALMASLIFNAISIIYDAENLKLEGHLEAYEKIREYTEETPTFLTGIAFSDYYAKDIFKNYTWKPMTNSQFENQYDHIGELIDISETHPEGIITCEMGRIYQFNPFFYNVLKGNMFEKITGEGLDDTRIETWAYHIIHEKSLLEDWEEDGKVILFGNDFGGLVRIEDGEECVSIKLKLNGSVSEEMLLGIKVNMYTQGECRQEYVQLLLEPNQKNAQSYEIELEKPKGIIYDKVVIDDSYSFLVTHEDAVRESWGVIY